MSDAASNLRSATPADAGALARLHVEAWQWAYRGQMPDAFLEGLSVAKREQSWATMLSFPKTETRVWLAERAGQLVGFAATGLPWEGEPPHLPRTAELYAIYLSREVVGQGLGRVLLNHALEDLKARGFLRAYLWVLESNARARRFYAAAGLSADGDTKVAPREGFELREVRYRVSLQAPPELRTERLLLRPWRLADLEPFAQLNADPVVMERFPAPLTRAESDAGVERIRARFDQYGFGFWAVEVPGMAELIGMAGLSVPGFQAPFMPAVEVGWRLAQAHWGKGYATEAARAAVQFGFQRLDLDEIVSFTVPGNVRSRRVMEKVGMTRHPEEDFDQPRVAEGHPLRRHVLYRVRRTCPDVAEQARRRCRY